MGVVSMGSGTLNTRWKDISFNAEQLLHFQNILMQGYPHLNLINSIGVILKSSHSVAENEALIYFVEGSDSLGSEDEGIKDQGVFEDFLRETRRYIEIGTRHNWQYDKIKSIILKEH